MERDHTVSGAWADGLPTHTSPPSQSKPPPTHDFLLSPLPLSQGLGQSPLQDPRPFGAVGQQQNVPGLGIANKQLRSSPQKAFSRQASSLLLYPFLGQAGLGLPHKARSSLTKNQGRVLRGFREAWPLVWNEGVSQSQILVAVQRSHGVGLCSPDSVNLG